jgi:hypothetical protein
VSGYPGAPPGWYPDPAGGPGQRWWDGYNWTDTTVLPAAPLAPPGWVAPPPGYGGSPYPQMAQPGLQNAPGAVEHELRITAVGRFALPFAGVATLVNLTTWVANAAQWRVFGHEFHLAMVAAQHNQTAPVVTVPSTFGAVTSLVGLCSIAAIVVKCIWQFRAATAARALRLPAKHSPGWGVGFRFIPIVNLWMPYQAVRDCLAPTDPNRALVLRWWLLAIGMTVGDALTIVGLALSTPIGTVFAILTALCAVAFLATAPKVVTSIAAAHRAALNP